MGSSASRVSSDEELLLHCTRETSVIDDLEDYDLFTHAALHVPLSPTGYRVQGFSAEDTSEDRHVYEPVTCPVCHQIHHVNRASGAVLEAQPACARRGAPDRREYRQAAGPPVRRAR